MKKQITTLVTFILLVATSAVLVLAGYNATISVVESNGTDYDMVAMDLTLDNDWLAANGFMSASGLDVDITHNGSSVPLLVVDDKLLFADGIDGNTTTPFLYSTGNTPASSMEIITGYDGYVSTSDNAALELSDDFEVELSGYVDTTAGADKYILRKLGGNGGFQIYVDDVTSGTITAEILETDTDVTIIDSDSSMPDAGSPSTIAQVDSDTWVSCRQGGNGDGFVDSWDIDTDGDNVTNVGYLEFDTDYGGSFSTIYERASNIFVFAYLGSNSGGGNTRYRVATINCSNDGQTITNIDNEIIIDEAYSTSRCEFLEITTGVYLFLGYYNGTLKAATITVEANGTINAPTDTATIATANNYDIDLVDCGSGVYGVFYSVTATGMKFDTFSVNGSYNITDEDTATIHSGTPYSSSNCEVECLGNGIVMTVYEEPATGDICIKTFQVDTGDASIGSIIDSESGSETFSEVPVDIISCGADLYLASNGAGVFGMTSDGYIGAVYNTVDLGDGRITKMGTSLYAIQYWPAPASGKLETYSQYGDVGAATVSVSATGISSGEIKITVVADTTDITINIDDSEEDSTALTGASVPDNGQPYYWIMNNVMPFANYITLDVSSVEKLKYQPTTMIIGDTLPDETGTYDGDITWGSNPAGLAMTIGAFAPSGTTPGYNNPIEQQPDVVIPVDQPGWFDPTGTLTTNPFYPLVIAISDNTGFTVVQVWLALATLIVLICMLVTLRFLPHLLVVSIVGGAVSGFFIAMGIFPFWIIFIFIVSAVASLIMERTPAL